MPFSTDNNHRQHQREQDAERQEHSDELPIWRWISKSIFPKVAYTTIFFFIAYAVVRILGSPL